MVFHSGHPTGSKKSGIGYRKKGASYRIYQDALSKAPVPEDPDPADAESDDDEREHGSSKKPRPDNNWRMARAVRARDPKLDKLTIAELTSRLKQLIRMQAKYK